MISEELSWDEVDQRVVTDLMLLHHQLHLEFLAILLYTPTDAMQEALSQMVASIRNGELRADKPEENVSMKPVPLALYRFSIGAVTADGDPTEDAGGPPLSFVLLVAAGDGVETPARARLEERVVQKRNSTPDCCDFCYIVDGDDSLVCPDLTIELGGFDKEEVAKRASQPPDISIFGGSSIEKRINNLQ